MASGTDLVLIVSLLSDLDPFQLCLSRPIVGRQPGYPTETHFSCLDNKKIPFFRYYQEFAPLGTAGGIYHFRDQIQRGNPEAFFVLNCDVCGDFPLTDMLDFHRSRRQGDHHSHRELFTMLGTEVILEFSSHTQSCFIYQRLLEL